MKAYIARALSGAASLEQCDIAGPGPLGLGQVRIAMRAVALNYRDHLILTGAYRARTLANLIPCSDGAGVVVETAADVWRVKPGDRVALTYSAHWIGGAWEMGPRPLGRGGGTHGVMCEEVVADQAELVALPGHLSFAEGATLPCAAVTAWHALCGPAALLPGMTVLSQGGGGVSIFALQFAKLFGARVIMISSSPERCARMARLGADATVDYRAIPQWDVAVRDLTQGRGVDVSLDIGGAQTIERSLLATRTGGRVALVGLLTGPPVPSAAIFSAGLVTPIKVGSRQDFEAMNRAITLHNLRPVIDRCFAFDEFPDALRHLQSGAHFGKIVVQIP